MKQIYCKCGCGNITPISPRNRYNLGHVKGEHINYLKGHKRRGIKGVDHYNWKGDTAGYKAFHLRVNQIRGRAKICEFCNSDYYVEWANLTGQYQNIYDYVALCRKCHHVIDNVADKGWQTRRGGGAHVHA
jgi:hypothetical protein